jgi:hypothetical protein
VWAVPDPVPHPETEPHGEDPTQVETPAEDEDDLLEDDPPLRWYVIAAYMVAVIVGFALAVLGTAYWYAGCQESTGKSTSFAGDSTRATLCESGHGVVGLLVPAGWVVGLVLATLALARWGGGRARTLFLAALFVSPIVLPAAAYGALDRSSVDCTGEKLEAYRAWVDDGSKGTAPYDCRKI